MWCAEAASRTLLGPLVAIVLAACQGGGEAPVTASGPGGQPTSPASECPTTPATSADSAAILVPGPSKGLSPSNVAGEPLVIDAIVLDAACNPVPGASINLWHTDARGRYGPEKAAGELECCYYQGTVRSDEAGRFRVETIKPGRYDRRGAPPAHIHLEVRHSAGTLMTEIVFVGDPGVPATAGRDGTTPIKLSRGGAAGGHSWYGETALVLKP